MSYCPTCADYEKKIKSLEGNVKRLERAIRECLTDNSHLADGDVCTLIKLKRVMEGGGK